MRLLLIVTGRAPALRASWAFRLLHNQFFNFPFGKHTQDDRGGYFDKLLHMISTKTKLLSVILSARSTRSFLQSSEASGKKSSRLRRWDLRTITNSLPRQKNCSECTNDTAGRGLVQAGDFFTKSSQKVFKIMKIMLDKWLIVWYNTALVRAKVRLSTVQIKRIRHGRKSIGRCKTWKK